MNFRQPPWELGGGLADEQVAMKASPWFCTPQEFWTLMATGGGWAALRQGFNGLGTGQTPRFPHGPFRAASSWDGASIRGVLPGLFQLPSPQGVQRPECLHSAV